MPKQRRQYSAEYKFKVALEAAKGAKTLAEMNCDTGVHANQISQWKAQLLDEGAGLFQRNGDKSVRELQQQEAQLTDGRGRALDNVFIERLMSCAAGLRPAPREARAQDERSLKYEDIYIKDYASVLELEAGLYAYFQFYNCERPHQALSYLTPAAVHFG